MYEHRKAGHFLIARFLAFRFLGPDTGRSLDCSSTLSTLVDHGYLPFLRLLQEARFESLRNLACLDGQHHYQYDDSLLMPPPSFVNQCSECSQERQNMSRENISFWTVDHVISRH